MTQPRGDVTLLFSDIEASTVLLQQLGDDRYEKALSQQRRLIREACGRRAGYEVSCEGDSFFVAFASAGAAAEAAAEAQRALAAADWPDGLPVRVRIGVHTGRPRIAPPNYVGVDVHRAARIMAAAHGGQILVSEDTAALLREQLPGGLALSDLGEHRLKDLSLPHRLFQLNGDQLAERFPPPRTADSRPTNLPARAQPLIGRTEELREISQLLTNHVRLLTLTGTGGIGKTRLALEAAREALETFPDGVYFVELAAIVDPELAVPSIANAIGLSDTREQALVAYLGKKRVLVVADNLEQVLAAGSRLADLLARAPNLAVLATSRAPLHVQGERVYQVPTLLETASSTLFADRAAERDSSFTLGNGNAADVREICARLDGLPLAIELAATRVSLLEPAEILRRLDSRLTLLTDGARDVPTRHQALRNTLTWSYELLDSRQQEVFARLGVFAGGFTLAAAEEAAEASLDEIAALVDASLIRKEHARFGMLETLREFALERLAELGIQEDARERHLRFLERLAESADEALSRGAQPIGLLAEADNYRAALDWLALDRSAARQLRLLASLGSMWDGTNSVEGHARLQSALVGYGKRDWTRARALCALADLKGNLGETEQAKQLTDEALELAGELGDKRLEVEIWHAVRWACTVAGDVPGNRKAVDHLVALAVELGDAMEILQGQALLVHAHVWGRDLDAYDRLAPEVLDDARRLGNSRIEVTCHYLASEAALARGKPEQAKAGFQTRLAFVAPYDERLACAITTEGVAMALTGEGADALAVRLAAAAYAELERCGFPAAHGGGSWLEMKRHYLGAARARLGDEAAEEAEAEGHAMAFPEAVALALES
ncbi:MAG: adenylate/guanylate cyclase domain-containing protein [Gaiellaceae bacterium]